MNKETRIELMKQNGIDTSNMFAFNVLNIPLGTPVKVTIGDKEYDLSLAEVDEQFTDLDKTDYVAQNIVNNGYVFNRRTDGRFVTAHTFKMLNYKSWINTDKFGWEGYLNNISYMYQFQMLKDEIHKQNRMLKENDPEFERLSCFFTPNVVVATCEDYMRKLRKFVNEQMEETTMKKLKKCKGNKYITLPKYGHVFCNEVEEKVFKPLGKILCVLKNYSMIIEGKQCNEDKKDFMLLFEKTYKLFYSKMVKLPWNTKKSSVWKDAFKGKGAYVTLLNITKFHGVTWDGMNTYDCVDHIECCRRAWIIKNELWRFHMMLKRVLNETGFDLQKSIDSQKK